MLPSGRRRPASLHLKVTLLSMPFLTGTRLKDKRGPTGKDWQPTLATSGVRDPVMRLSVMFLKVISHNIATSLSLQLCSVGGDTLREVK